MPKTSQPRLSTVFLSASLLLATAGSASASHASSSNASPSNASPSHANTSNADSRLAYLQAKTLQGNVSSTTTKFAIRPPVLFLDDLTESALHIKQSLQASGQASGQAPEQNASTLQTMGKSTLNFVPNYFNYRPSRAAAQVFLGSARPEEEVGEGEGELSERNKLALTLTATMMQIAKGLGDPENKSAELSIERGRSKLTQLLGKGQADWVLTRMTAWAEQVKSNSKAANSGAANLEAAYLQESDVLEQEEQVSALVARAIARDQQINNLKAAIGIHDQAPTGAERSLTLAGLTPTLIGPAAKLAQYAVERGTGGTRSKRLDEVLTLGVAMQERITLLTRESELAINNLERARSSKNDVLYVFAKDLIAKLGGP